MVLDYADMIINTWAKTSNGLKEIKYLSVFTQLQQFKNVWLKFRNAREHANFERCNRISWPKTKNLRNRISLLVQDTGSLLSNNDVTLSLSSKN